MSIDHRGSHIAVAQEFLYCLYSGVIEIGNTIVCYIFVVNGQF